MLRLKEIRNELQKIEHGSQSRAGTSRGSCGKKKGSKEKFVIQAASLNSGAGPSKSKASFSSNRRLNESVVECVFKPKKISSMEKEAMTTKVIKTEANSPPNPYECCFCPKSFTSAAPLVIHMEKHYAKNQVMFDCPFSICSFSANKEYLTKHVRSKHTKEQLFICSSCPTRFHTMLAKVSHQKKHSQPALWAQCGKATCLRFYQVARGCCRCSNK
eukprot:GFUD01065412.1.p1 GENE.GFUD01065412.1~~GFUD01065412.1.p1  ORF type:complete len:248 (-),score=63.12 GFUD01065412.1:30-677(-)